MLDFTTLTSPNRLRPALRIHVDHLNALRPERTGNASKVFDNRAVCTGLQHFSGYAALVEANPRAECILTGVSWLQSPGHTATRPLSRVTILRVLSACPWITTATVREALASHGYSQAHLSRYAAAGRVASTALQRLLPLASDESVQAEAIADEDAEAALDAPFLAAFQELEATNSISHLQ
jgi:hypothetical protein